MTRPRHALLACLLAAGALGGCGVHDPYNAPPRTTRTAPPARGTTGEPSPASAAPAHSAADALRGFAQTYANWTFDSLATTRTALAQRATGAARTQLVREARMAADDASRRASTQANRGTVAGILVQPGGWAYVITHETALFGGQAEQGGYFLYRARATQTDAGWTVSEWRAIG